MNRISYQTLLKTRDCNEEKHHLLGNNEDMNPLRTMHIKIRSTQHMPGENPN